MADLFQGGGPAVIGPTALAGAQMVMMRLKRTVKIGRVSHGPNTILSVPVAQAEIWRGDGTAEDYTPPLQEPEQEPDPKPAPEPEPEPKPKSAKKKAAGK